jgi:hypothetical protein
MGSLMICQLLRLPNPPSLLTMQTPGGSGGFTVIRGKTDKCADSKKRKRVGLLKIIKRIFTNMNFGV